MNQDNFKNNDQLEQYFAQMKQTIKNMEAPSYFDQTIRESAAGAQTNKSGKQGIFPTLFSGRKKYISGAAALAVVVIAFVAVYFSGNSLQQAFTGLIEVKPAYASSTGIDLNQGFVITSDQKMSAELIEDSIEITPSFDYTLEKSNGGKEFTIVPTESLQENTVYQIVLDPERQTEGLPARYENSWSFQTTTVFAVDSILPRDTTSYVPVNTAIQVSFSQEIDLEKASAAITIEPDLKGKWQKEYNTLTFVPSQPMQYGTIYTVTVASGINNLDGSATLEEQSVSRFETEPQTKDNNDVFYISGENNSFRSSEIPVFSFDYYDYNNGGQAASIDVALYQYDSQANYLADLAKRNSGYWWSSSENEKDVDPTANYLNQTATFTLSPQAGKSYGTYLYFPESLPNGYYLATFSNGELERQVLFQITDLSAYMAYDYAENLIWVNDLASGNAIDGAAISVYEGTTKATTNADGVAQFPMEEADPTKNQTEIVRVQKDDQSLVLLTQSYYYYDTQYQQKNNIATNYWSYLYADRSLYRPGDTINFFGVIAPRQDTVAAVGSVKLVLSGWSIPGQSDFSQTVPVENNIFDGTFKLPSLKPGYYELSLYYTDPQLGDVYITGTYFEVAMYEKPTYKITLASDKQGIMNGDTITWTVNTAFFEGTPLPNSSVNIQSDSKEPLIKQTDANGELQFAQKVNTGSTYFMSSSYFWVSATFPELGQVTKDATIYVFNQDIDFDRTADRNGKQFTLSVTPYDVDITRITDWNEDLAKQYREPFTGSTTLTVQVYRSYWEKVQTGTYLDPYTKLVSPKYEYNYKEDLENTLTMTLDSASLAKLDGMLATDSAYTFKVSGKDHKSRPLYWEVYLPALSSAPSPDDYVYLSLQPKDYDYKYAIGDQVNLYLQYGENQLDIANGKALYFRFMQNIMDYKVSKDSNYSFTFTQDNLPNINTQAVYFDGRNYRYSNRCASYIDPATRKLNAEVTFDKENYKPGEEAKIDVLLTDEAGNPIKGFVNLNLVDEALLALRDQTVNFVDDLLSNNTYDTYFYSIVSHVAPEGGGGAEQGGEGDGGREDFRDTALFETVQTDASGKASVTLTLPDNITSWRVIWQAYSSNLYAGNGIANLDVSLPFFLDYRLGDTFIIGDQPVLGIRGAGNAIDPAASNSVTFTVDISALNFHKEQSGAPYTWSDIELPILSAGDYDYTITAKYQTYSDSINGSFHVVNSLTSYQKTQTTTLAEGAKLPGAAKGLTTLAFSDQAHALALEGLHNLAWQGNIRLEQRLASEIAQKALNDYYGTEFYTIDESANREAMLAYQLNDGGIAPLTYAAASLETSALAASFAPDTFDKVLLVNYFYTQLDAARQNNDLRKQSLALWGLAALSQPVLTQIEELLSNQNLPAESKLFLAGGLYFAGDGADAKTLTKELIATWTNKLDNTIRAEVSDDRSQNLTATARLALLANLFDLPEANALYQYVLQNHNDDDYYLLEQVGILKARMNHLVSPASFTYQIGDGDKVGVDLKSTLYYTLTVDETQLASLKFSKIEGIVTVSSSYEQEGISPEQNTASGALFVSRSITRDGNKLEVIPQTGQSIVTLSFTIKENAPAGFYNLVDILPAGLRFVALVNENEIPKAYLYEVDGQKLTFGVYKNKTTVSGTAKYYVRTAQPGSFQWEAPYIMHSMENSVFSAAPANRITIK